MDDLISRQAAIDAFNCTNELIVGGEANAQNVANYINKVVGKIKDLPSAQQKECEYWDNESHYCALNRPSAQQERKTGKWTEKHHAYNDEDPVIEEWQSCCCSVCGRYDTRPYMYYFSEPNYCSYCGAKMEKSNG